MQTRLFPLASTSALRSASTSAAQRCSFCGSQLVAPPTSSFSTQAYDRKGKSVVRDAQQSLSSVESPIPFATTSTFSSHSNRRYYSTPALVKLPDKPSPSITLDNALELGSRRACRAALDQFSPHEGYALSRTTFDKVFSLLSQADETKSSEYLGGEGWSNLKKLRELAIRRGWKLHDQQLRAVFEFGVRWEELRRVREDRISSAEDVPWDDSPEREVERAKLLDEIWREYALLDPPETEGEVERQAETLERFALSVLYRGTHAEGPFMEAYEASVESIRPSQTPTTSALASTFLYILLQRDPSLAISHLHVMLDGNRLPTQAIMYRIVKESEKDTVDLYDVAREVLDGIKGATDSGTGNLESLYRWRMERIAREAWMAQNPSLAFIRWLGLERPRETSQTSTNEFLPMEEDWLLAALRVWETVYGLDDDRRKLANELLFKLVVRVCEVESARLTSSLSSPPLVPPLLLEKAVNLSINHLPSDLLVFLSHRLLHATCILTPSPLLAKTLYNNLRRQAPPASKVPFKWSASLIPELLYLLESGATHDPAFTIKVYYDFTGDGFEMLPIRALRALWRALGERGDVKEVSRLVGDIKESGREVPKKMITEVLKASCRGGRTLKALNLFKFFRDATSPSTSLDGVGTKGPTRIPTAAYNQLFQVLATSELDRRPEITKLFDFMRRDEKSPNLETWNLILSSHVFRPFIRTSDLDLATSLYSSLLSQKTVSPDSTTYSLLVHGLVRWCLRNFDGNSNTRKLRRQFLETGVNVCEKAIECGERVKGQQTSSLMRALAVDEEWEKAKGLAEEWWKSLAKDDARKKGEREKGENERMELEMTEMRRAGKEVEKMEAKRKGVMGDVGKSAAVDPPQRVFTVVVEDEPDVTAN